MRDHKQRILVTGASGFIGQNLMARWQREDELVPVAFSKTEVKDIDLKPGDVIIHLSGIAHQEKTVDPSIYAKVNFEKALALAKKAKEEGASQFIYISSTKVYGDATGLVKQDSEPAPKDPYGQSKYLAEQAIRKLQSESFTVSIVRPPLVYGAGVKGNMQKLLKLCASGKPLPFKGINNERSVVFVGNLIAMIERIVDRRAAGIFIPADDRPLSTFAILKLMKQKLGTTNLEVRIPKLMIRAISMVRPGLAAKVFGSLVYDNQPSLLQLDFKNPYSTEHGFDEMVASYGVKQKQ